MKYIKLFEDLLTPLNTNSIKGLLVELEDNGFDIKYKNTCMWPTNTLPGLFSNATDWDWEEVNGYIVKISKESFTYNDIKENVEILIEYYDYVIHNYDILFSFTSSPLDDFLTPKVSNNISDVEKFLTNRKLSLFVIKIKNKS